MSVCYHKQRVTQEPQFIRRQLLGDVSNNTGPIGHRLERTDHAV
jgi:hypothetical protein